MKKVFEKPDGYTCPYYTSTMVAELLELNVTTVHRKKDQFATEVVPGIRYWSEEDIQKLIDSDPRRGKPDFYKYSRNYKKSMANKQNNIDNDIID